MIKIQWATELYMTHTFLWADFISIALQWESSPIGRKTTWKLWLIGETQRLCERTWFEAVDDLGVLALVFVESRNLEDSRAYGGGFKHSARVRRAYEPGGVVVGVLYIDINADKVPLHRDVLISYL